LPTVQARRRQAKCRRANTIPFVTA
jgi:hypothetical protein